MRRSALAVLISLFSLAMGIAGSPRALAQPRMDPTSPTPDMPADLGPQTPEDLARRAHVIASVGAATITVGDVEDQIARQSPFMRARFRDPAQMRELVQNMIRFELLSREADRQGFGSDREVREATSQSAVQQLIRDRFDTRITPESIPAADVQAYYDAHPDEFSRPEVRRASHILVATRERADELAAEVRTADARTFRALAQEQSLDAESRARGGDLRYFDDQGRTPNSGDAAVDLNLVRTAFALGDVGDVSAPVELSGQWSVVKLTGRRPTEHRSVEEAGPSIRLRLWRERRQSAIDTFVEGLRTSTAVEVFQDRMRPIHMEPPERTSEDDPAAEGEPDEGEAVGEAEAVGSPTEAPEGE